MPTVPQMIEMRQRRRSQARRKPQGCLGLSVSTLFSVTLAVLFIAASFTYASLFGQLPSLETIPALLEPPDGLLRQPTRLTDRTGQHTLLTLQNPAAQGSRWLMPPDASSPDPTFPAELITATLGLSDPSFWKHPGFLLNGLLQDQHPTLAQKLVSDLLLWEEPPGLRRALRERFLAAQLTSHFGRQKILEWYLNSASYGPQIYGADAAARVYLGKGAEKLNLAESALLASVAQAPALNPLNAPDAALERQQVALRILLDRGWISLEELVAARQAGLQFVPPTAQEPNPAAQFAELVLNTLPAGLQLSRLERGGFTLTTSLDWDLNLQTQCALANHLARFQDPSVDLPALDGSPCRAARLLPTLTPAPGPEGMQAGVVITDPSTGQILALAGGQELFRPHPAGSSLTPFIYLHALAQGDSPSTLVWDIPAPEEAEISPTLRLDSARGPLRLRLALANDALRPALQRLAQLGPETVWRTARQTGLDSLQTLPAPTTSPLDAQAVTLLDLTHAYGIFSNRGILVGAPQSTPATLPPALQSIPLLQVQDASGQVWWSAEAAEARPVISPQLAYLMTHMLSDEVARWPSLGHPNPLEIGRPAGVKMGQTQNQQDAWAIGYLPQRTVGVWVGLPEGSTSEIPVPTHAASALWHAVIQTVANSLPPEDWPRPDGVVQMNVCDPSGLLPTAACPSLVNEVFLAGSEPSQLDTLFQSIPINRETGLLATAFTPPDLIEERIFLIAPYEARAWARASGVESPPNAYDVLPAIPQKSDAQITFPASFASVKGNVEIRGRATGEDFKYYRIQVGEGLNPQSWLQIGEDNSQRVQEGTLATWDTQGTNGLFVVQLLVVRQDDRVERSLVQVMVDSEPPTGRVVMPEAGSRFRSNQPILLQVEAQDNFAVERVEFWDQNSLLGVVQQAPYELAWKANVATPTLTVKIFDRAGNVFETDATFEAGS